MIIETPLALSSYDDDSTAEVAGTLKLSPVSVEILLDDGRCVLIEVDDLGLRVHAYATEVDSPISLTLPKDSDRVHVNTEDFIETGGTVVNPYA
jgi:hypothetical protein